MKAARWYGKRDIRVEDVPDPVIQQPTDTIVRITSSAICGSDLHLYEVLGPFVHKGDILGHEAIGVVEQVGPGAQTHLSPGDRVVVPCIIACGACRMCRRRLYAQCETTQSQEHGTGAALFGYTELYGDVDGAQAEYLRVPQAHFGPIKVPHGPPDDRFIYLSDILPAGWQAAVYADIPAGGTVAVYGLGPVGQFSARVARIRGAQVFGIDVIPERLEMARRHGIEAIDASQADNLVGVLRDRTAGLGPDSMIDAVGMEAAGGQLARAGQALAAKLPEAVGRPVAAHLGVDRLKVLTDCIEAVRRGGTISIVGLYSGAVDPLPMLNMFDKGIQLRMGQVHVRRWVDELLALVHDDADPLGTDDLASHYLPLTQATEGYHLFQHKQDGCTKVLLQPGRVEPEIFPGGRGTYAAPAQFAS